MAPGEARLASRGIRGFFSSLPPTRFPPLRRGIFLSAPYGPPGRHSLWLERGVTGRSCGLRRRRHPAGCHREVRGRPAPHKGRHPAGSWGESSTTRSPASCRLASRADEDGPNAVSYPVRSLLPRQAQPSRGRTIRHDPAGENKSDLFSGPVRRQARPAENKSDLFFGSVFRAPAAPRVRQTSAAGRTPAKRWLIGSSAKPAGCRRLSTTPAARRAAQGQARPAWMPAAVRAWTPLEYVNRAGRTPASPRHASDLRTLPPRTSLAAPNR